MVDNALSVGVNNNDRRKGEQYESPDYHGA